MMEVVINRSGSELRIPEIQKVIPWDGKKYMLHSEFVRRYRGYLEVVDVKVKEKEELLKQAEKELKIEINNFNAEKTKLADRDFLHELVEQHSPNRRCCFLYSFDFKEKEIDNAIKRLNISIKSIIDQNVDVCICNTSKIDIKKSITNINKIRYLYYPLKQENYCKPKTINIGVRKLVNSEYFFLSDIDLIYPPSFVKNMLSYTLYKEPVRIIFFNYNLGKCIDYKNFKTYKKLLERVKDSQRTTIGIAPGNGLVHLKSFHKIGGFDERYIGYGPEDADFNLRISIINKYVEVNYDKVNTYHLYHPININQEYNNKNIELYNKVCSKIKKYNKKVPLKWTVSGNIK